MYPLASSRRSSVRTVALVSGLSTAPNTSAAVTEPRVHTMVITECSSGLRFPGGRATPSSVTCCHFRGNLSAPRLVQADCYMMSPSHLPVVRTVRLALRQQRRSVGASLLIVLTLGVALGANAAMLSVADALLVRAVPFSDPARLVAVQTAFPSMKLTGMNLSG